MSPWSAAVTTHTLCAPVTGLSAKAVRAAVQRALALRRASLLLVPQVSDASVRLRWLAPPNGAHKYRVEVRARGREFQLVHQGHDCRVVVSRPRGWAASHGVEFRVVSLNRDLEGDALAAPRVFVPAVRARAPTTRALSRGEAIRRPAAR